MSNVVPLFREPVEGRQEKAKGYGLLYRKLKDCSFYKDSEAVHLWVHFILTATHKPIQINTECGLVNLERGQFISGRNSLSIETGIKPERIQYLIRKFEKLGMIKTNPTKKFTVFSIVKYEEYQSDFLPSNYHQITIVEAEPERVKEQVVPSNYHQITTYNKDLNISNTNVLDISTTQPENPDHQEEKKPVTTEKKKPQIRCEEIIAVYREILPEAKQIRALTDKRRNQIRTFWSKASKITRQLDGKPFTLDSWKAYLEYVSKNCRWMLEDRPDNKTGKTWRRKGFEYFLNDETYLQVREGAKDDI